MVVSNYHVRSFEYGNDVPSEVMSDYDHLDEEDRTYWWILYRGDWSHISDYLRSGGAWNIFCPDDWDGIHVDSYYTALVIKLDNDGENYRIGMFSHNNIIPEHTL